MKIDQFKINSDFEIRYTKENIDNKNLAQIVLAFGDRLLLETEGWYDKIRTIYPTSSIITSSSAGNISDIKFTTKNIIVTVIYFEKTVFETNILNSKDFSNSKELGISLASKFNVKDLSHIFIISDGQNVNGSDLILGFKEILPTNIIITGGLAGDSTRFEKTLVGLDTDIKSGNIVAIGFYGESIKISYGSKGGWDPFGPVRIITKSSGNVLYEFDNENALALYKLYLGDKAKDLPASSLFFPLGIFSTENGQFLVRTILNINEEEQSMTFAGDVPIGSKVQLMKANFENLIDGAMDAAKVAQNTYDDKNPEFAILVSCVGRKLVLGQRIEEELEAIQEVFGINTVLSGFYSYGELCPTVSGHYADLQNQTMTITTFSEK
ncbi:MAG: FIST C-terminal domain-containing protein [Candidatus Kapabacteria bacterium]|nr:FIST C-terminal domain-containing protein [Candidatus Kapabacteria bacterium]